MKPIKWVITCTILILMAAAFTFAGTAATARGEVLSKPETTSGRIKKEVILPKNADSAKLQELLDENKNGEYDLIIQVPEGTYRLDHELRIYSNTTIEADLKAVFQKMHRRGALLANDLTQDQGGFSASRNTIPFRKHPE